MELNNEIYSIQFEFSRTTHIVQKLTIRLNDEIYYI